MSGNRRRGQARRAGAGGSVAAGPGAFPFPGLDDPPAEGAQAPGTPPSGTPVPTPFADATMSAGGPAAPPSPWGASSVDTSVPALDDVFGSTGPASEAGDDAGRSSRRGESGARKATKKATKSSAKKKSKKKSGKTASTSDAKPSARSSTTKKRVKRSASTTSGAAGPSRSGSRPERSRGGSAGPFGRLAAAAAALPRRRAEGIFARRATLLGAAAVALVAGVGAGAGVGAVGLGASSASMTSDAPDAEAHPATPEACASAQVAWSRAAAAQVRMDPENPASLRTGFVGARDALSRVTPPGAVAADWAVVLEYVDVVSVAVETAEGDAAIEEAAADAMETLDTATFTGASGRITQYLAADCDDQIVQDDSF